MREKAFWFIIGASLATTIVTEYAHRQMDKVENLINTYQRTEELYDQNYVLMKELISEYEWRYEACQKRTAL